MGADRRRTLTLLAVLVVACAGPTPAPAPASPPADGLYSASARDYGFDFEGHVWEVDRLPQSSLVRRCLHPDVVSNRLFFVTGCTGELTLLRGYRHSWQLRADLVPCRLDPDAQDREVLLAFTQEASAFELPLLMLRAWLGPGYAQWSSEATQSIAMARRQLGHWPPSSN